MTASYLSDAEVEEIQHLPRETPYLISHVSYGQLSVARHYGGCTHRGASYTYMSETDELVRGDVVRFVKKMRRKNKPSAETMQAVQSILDLS